VLTLLWGGGRGCSESGWGQLCSVGVQGVCAGGRIRLPPKTLSGDDARVCPPSTPHQLSRVQCALLVSRMQCAPVEAIALQAARVRVP
jgi:hypothetical protein